MLPNMETEPDRYQTGARPSGLQESASGRYPLHVVRPQKGSVDVYEELAEGRISPGDFVRYREQSDADHTPFERSLAFVGGLETINALLIACVMCLLCALTVKVFL